MPVARHLIFTVCAEFFLSSAEADTSAVLDREIYETAGRLLFRLANDGIAVIYTCECTTDISTRLR
jgi:hypothetical protein